MKIIIDRFEGDHIVVELEDGNLVDMPRSLVPDGAIEGDVILITLNKEEANERKKRIEEMTKDLWE